MKMNRFETTFYMLMAILPLVAGFILLVHTDESVPIVIVLLITGLCTLLWLMSAFGFPQVMMQMDFHYTYFRGKGTMTREVRNLLESRGIYGTGLG